MAKDSRRSLAFGWHSVDHLLRQRPQDVLEVHLLEDRRDQRAAAVLASLKIAGVHVRTGSREHLDRMTDGAHHQGIVALVRPLPPLDFEVLLESLTERSDPLLLVLDGVQDPHNLGACLRSADAAGVAAVIAPRRRSAPLNETARKVACGAAESVPFVPVANLARTLRALSEQGIRLVGTSDQAQQSLYACGLTGPLALVMGGEARGLRRLTREACDELVALPMAGAVDSLNVSVAAGICLFEAVRQRTTG